MYKFSSRLARAWFLAASFLIGLAAVPALHQSSVAAPAEAGGSTTEVDATYKITLNGFELGSFRFSSNVGRDRYTLDTNVELSAVLGIFHWKGVTRSTGTLVASKPKPAGFLFEYDSSAKSGSVQMGFGEKGVERLSVLPAALQSPDTVPLREQHLKGVLDPLTAIMAITHTDAPSPCGRRIEIFDGMQRFDLELLFARNEPLAGTRETQIVCRIKYRPIAGYAPTPETAALASSDGMEIAFRPVPTVKLMLPQSVVVPTTAGEAQVTLTAVSIKADRGQLASVD